MIICVVCALPCHSLDTHTHGLVCCCCCMVSSRQTLCAARKLARWLAAAIIIIIIIISIIIMIIVGKVSKSKLSCDILCIKSRREGEAARGWRSQKPVWITFNEMACLLNLFLIRDRYHQTHFWNLRSRLFAWRIVRALSLPAWCPDAACSAAEHNHTLVQIICQRCSYYPPVWCDFCHFMLWGHLCVCVFKLKTWQKSCSEQRRNWTTIISSLTPSHTHTHIPT